MADINIADIRKEYKLQSLLEKDVDADPIRQFQKWWNEAMMSNIEEPNAMTLAASNKEGKPSARIVLLKSLSNDGFVFFTNYESRKGNELKENPQAALLFFWKELERQVRVEGTVTKTDEQKSTAYFVSRPALSKISAWSSPQSKVIQSREELENNVLKYQQQFSDGVIPRPPHWGGYVVKPTLIEFWQGRPSRLHDRLQYTHGNDKWLIERLAP
ncbi:MAG: Pyridoxamine 5-phosphate oxidase [Chitinophagaceae bacterium]|nr:Pyridoxamine 5-phosphate oxidase [Chitinophagaceae bacterium]